MWPAKRSERRLAFDASGIEVGEFAAEAAAG
jgi:hypothetical protein